MQETITSNVADDIITLEFQRTDGTLVTLLLDFRNVSKTKNTYTQHAKQSILYHPIPLCSLKNKSAYGESTTSELIEQKK